MRNAFRYFLIFFLLVANISCDQISKNLVREKMFPHQEINVLSDYFRLVKVENKGAFLSLGTSLPQPIKSAVLSFLPLMFLIVAAIYVFVNRKLSLSRVVAITFVVGGGIGNISDRIRLGSVTDFLHIDLGIIQTGIFNMADVSIMVGMTMLLIESFISRNEEIFAGAENPDLKNTND